MRTAITLRLRTLSPLHITAPEDCRVTLDGKRVYGQQGFPCSLTQKLSIPLRAEDSKDERRSQSVPLIPANTIRGRLRRMSAKSILDQIEAKGEKLSLPAWQGLQSGAIGLMIFSASACPRRQWWMWAGAYLLMGLAVLTKGPVGVLVPYGSWICYTAAQGEFSLLRKGHLLWGPLLALLPAALWLGAMMRFEPPPPGFLDELLFKQNLGRVDGSFARGHLRPFWYFLKYLPVDFMPWTLLMPVAFLTLIREKKTGAPFRRSSRTGLRRARPFFARCLARGGDR